MSEPVLIVKNIAKHFGGIKALQDVSLDFAKGELQCVIGPNGAGKSTFFNAITGMFRLTAGSVEFEGRDIVGLPIHEIARIGITRKFQVPSVFESMTVRDNLQVALPGLKPRANWKERVKHILKMTRLEELAEVQTSTLSHGQKQWLEIGMAVMPQPKLLLLDEPTAGMTTEETQKTAKLLLGFKGDLTIVVIEHDMRFVRTLDSRTIVMHQGKILRDGVFAEIEQDKTVRDVYLGRQ